MQELLQDPGMTNTKRDEEVRIMGSQLKLLCWVLIVGFGLAGFLVGAVVAWLFGLGTALLSFGLLATVSGVVLWFITWIWAGGGS